MNTVFSKISEIVPQFYYDFVARIVPGSVICIYYGYSGIIPAINEIGSSEKILFGSILSYLIGFILDYPSEWIFDKISYIVNFLRNKVTKYSSDAQFWDDIDDISDENRAHPEIVLFIDCEPVEIYAPVIRQALDLSV